MKRLLIFLLVICLFTGLTGCGVTTTSEPPGTVSQEVAGENLRVHFLDVGQGDCILVQLPNGQNMLVDAGKNDSATTIIEYLQGQKITRLDYLVGTHPHEDHIGSLDKVIERFSIGEILLPRATNNTKTFREVLEAVDSKGLQVTTAKAGVNILEEDGLSVKILAPVASSYEDLNNYSAVIKITYRDVSFLLTGDAEAASEKEMLNCNAYLRADVLKVGHHGSSSSTTPAFLNKIQPVYAVISLGADNDYGHPHKETLAKLQKTGINILRTDQSGTTVFSTDGKDIEVSTEK